MKTDIHIFSPGTQTSAQGVTREFTATDLKQVVDSYNSELHEAPIRIGHEDNDKVPSWGWVKNVKMKGEDLYAEVEFSPLMDEYVQNGLYKKVSASFYAPESKINPDPGKWSLRHVAMLGAQPPAVKGLKGFAYSEESEADGVLDFAVEMKLSPDQVFDEELGPTVREEQSPLEQLKVKLDEARTEMAQEEKRKEDLGQAEEDLKAEGVIDEDFAEEDMKKKPAKKAKQGAEDAEEEIEGNSEDDVQSKEKKMDPVGKEDSDVDNDGDSDSSDEYLKKRRAAIKKSMADDKSDNSEEDTADHAGSCGSKKNYKEGKKYTEEEGEDTMDNQEFETDEGEGPVASKVKKDAGSGKSALDHSEIAVPEGVDAAQWEAGFKDAVDKFYSAAAEGADEVVHQETEDQTADYIAGIEAGFEFAQSRVLSDGKDMSAGSSKHDDKCCDTDEESEGEGPVASKVKKNAKVGESECCPEGDNNFQEATFEPSKKKRGHDSDKSSDVGVKAESNYEEDEEQHAENSDFGRDKVGKAGEDGKSNRKKLGKAKAGDLGTQAQADAKGSDGGAQDKDRASKGTGSEPKQDGGKSKDVQDSDGVELKPATDAKKGSGKAIKSPAVRVMKIGNYSEGPDFSELTARLAELEAANAKLVQEKIAAERHAHRMQLEEFTESLFASGRLTPAVCEAEELVDYMEGLEYGTLEFAEGETAATKLMELLAALPAQVEFSEVVTHDDEAVPMENLNPHEQALRLSKEEGMDYAEALKQTLFSAQ